MLCQMKSMLDCSEGLIYLLVDRDVRLEGNAEEGKRKERREARDRRWQVSKSPPFPSPLTLPLLHLYSARRLNHPEGKSSF